MIQEHPDDVEAWIELAGILEESETVVGGVGAGGWSWGGWSWGGPGVVWTKGWVMDIGFVGKEIHLSV